MSSGQARSRTVAEFDFLIHTYYNNETMTDSIMGEVIDDDDLYGMCPSRLVKDILLEDFHFVNINDINTGTPANTSMDVLLQEVKNYVDTVNTTVVDGAATTSTEVSTDANNNTDTGIDEIRDNIFCDSNDDYEELARQAKELSMHTASMVNKPPPLNLLPPTTTSTSYRYYPPPHSSPVTYQRDRNNYRNTQYHDASYSDSSEDGDGVPDIFNWKTYTDVGATTRSRSATTRHGSSSTPFGGHDYSSRINDISKTLAHLTDTVRADARKMDVINDKLDMLLRRVGIINDKLEFIAKDVNEVQGGVYELVQRSDQLGAMFGGGSTSETMTYHL